MYFALISGAQSGAVWHWAYIADGNMLNSLAQKSLARTENPRVGTLAHHVGGVTMASRAAVLASSSKVIRLATFQAKAQIFEISQYNILLAGSYTTD